MKVKDLNRKYYRLTLCNNECCINKTSREKIHTVCDCGTEKLIKPDTILWGRTKSCGCLNLDLVRMRSTTHGMSTSSENKIWRKIKSRCTNPNNTGYKNYGGRGIKMCDEWFNDFQAFYDYVGPRPSPSHSIDRINNNEGYKPGNVRWATPLQQSNNKRSNIIFNGEHASEASLRLGGNKKLVACRIRDGWPIERAFTTPVQMKYHNKSRAQSEDTQRAIAQLLTK